MGHPARMRASDAEREAVVAQLGRATGEGRLTLDEFSARSRHAYAARTRFELYRIVDDLPSPVAIGRAAPVRNDSTPLTALIFGVLSLPLSSYLPLGLISAAIGVLLGLITLGSGHRRSSRDRTLAVVGLVCGLLGIVLPIGLAMLFGLSLS